MSEREAAVEAAALERVKALEERERQVREDMQKLAEEMVIEERERGEKRFLFFVLIYFQL